MKAVVTATIEQLRSIGIHCDGLVNDDFGPGVEVRIIDESFYECPQYGKMVEVEYLYETLCYTLPKKWLKII